MNNRSICRALCLAACAGSFASLASAQVVSRESVDGLGAGATQGNGASTLAQLSIEGTSIVFRTTATNFSDGSSGVAANRIVRRNRTTGQVSMISGSGVGASPPLSGEVPAFGVNTRPAFRGQSIAYSNDADISGLCSDSNGLMDIYVGSGVPTPRTFAPGGICGTPSNGASDNASMSIDSSVIAFDTFSTTFSVGDTGTRDVYVMPAVGLVSYSKKSVTGSPLVGVTPGNGDSSNPAIAVTGGGTFTVFESLANNLVTDTNGVRDIFVRIEPSGISFPSTARVSVGAGGAEANGASFNPDISGASGRYVVFSSDATNLVSGDTNGVRDVFMHDRTSGTTRRLSVSKEGVQGNAASDNPVVNVNGEWVAFQSTATNLVTNFGTAAGRSHVYLVHVPTGSVFLCDFNYTSQVEGSSGAFNPSIDETGLKVAFESDATNLQSVLADTNGQRDVFVYTRGAIPGNDTCENAAGISLGTVSGSTNGALPSLGLTIAGCANIADSPDVWYTFTSTCAGPYRFTTAGTSDTALAVFASCGGSILGCNDDIGGGNLNSQVDVNLAANQTVLVRVGGFRNRSGDFDLTASYQGASPANDNCTGAQLVSVGDTAVSTCGATTDVGQPNASCVFNPSADVWFIFSPSEAKPWTVQTVGNSFDTTLEIYKGIVCPMLLANEVACNDDAPGPTLRSRASFNGTVQPYFIRLGGFQGAQGTTTLRIGITPCNPADVASVGDPGNPAPLGPDHQLTVDDLVVFVNDFSDSNGCPGVIPCNRADITAVGGTLEAPLGPDGQLTVDDLVLFVNFFSDGCSF